MNMASVLNFGHGCFFLYGKIVTFVNYEWYKQD